MHYVKMLVTVPVEKVHTTDVTSRSTLNRRKGRMGLKAQFQNTYLKNMNTRVRHQKGWPVQVSSTTYFQSVLPEEFVQ